MDQWALELAFEPSQLQHHPRQELASEVWKVALWPLLRQNVPEDLRKQVAALHKEALRRWALSQLLEHSYRQKPPEVAELAVLLRSLDRAWWPDEEHPHELAKLEERLAESHPLVAARLQAQLELECEVR